MKVEGNNIIISAKQAIKEGGETRYTAHIDIKGIIHKLLKVISSEPLSPELDPLISGKVLT